jgi:hypothetical protein
MWKSIGHMCISLILKCSSDSGEMTNVLIFFVKFTGTQFTGLYSVQQSM